MFIVEEQLLQQGVTALLFLLNLYMYHYCIGYVYYWYFSIPWLIIGLVGRPAIRPTYSERHAGAKRWARALAKMTVLSRILCHGILIWRRRGDAAQNSLELEEVLLCSLVAGGLANFRQSPRNIACGMLCCFGYTCFAIVYEIGEDGMAEIYQRSRRGYPKTRRAKGGSTDRSEHTVETDFASR